MKMIIVFVLLLFLTGCANLGNWTRVALSALSEAGQQMPQQQQLDPQRQRQRVTDQLDREFQHRKLKRELKGNW